MSNMIQSKHFTDALLMLLTETFEMVRCFYLDKGTSLFETLSGISAEEASIPVGRKCATLAAQVKHVAFYLEVVEKSVTDPDYPQVDWNEIWNHVNVVDETQWQEIQDELHQRYTDIQKLVKNAPEWPSEREIGGAMALLAHSAYHLGEIRQALCTLR